MAVGGDEFGFCAVSAVASSGHHAVHTVQSAIPDAVVVVKVHRNVEWSGAIFRGRRLDVPTPTLDEELHALQ